MYSDRKGHLKILLLCWIPTGADNPSIELCTRIIMKYETTAQGKEQVSFAQSILGEGGRGEGGGGRGWMG